MKFFLGRVNQYFKHEHTLSFLLSVLASLLGNIDHLNLSVGEKPLRVHFFFGFAANGTKIPLNGQTPCQPFIRTKLLPSVLINMVQFV